MRKNNYWTMTAILTTLLFAGCGSDHTLNSKDINSKEVFQRYFVKYDKAEKKLHTEVHFRTSSTGDFVKLSSPQLIKTQTTSASMPSHPSSYTAMEETQIRPKLFGRKVTVYEQNSQRDLTEELAINFYWFDDQTKKTFVTRTSLAPFEIIGSFPNQKDGLFLEEKKAMNLWWEEPLKAGETVTMCVNHLSLAVSVCHAAGAGSTTLSIDHQRYQRLQPGQARVNISRTLFRKAHNKTPKGGEVQVTVSEEPFVIEIK